MNPLITVILIGHNEPSQRMAEQIKLIYGQTLQPFEIIFVDTSLNPIGEELEEVFSSQEMIQFRYFFIGKNFPGTARNFGIAKSSGEIIAFLDMMTSPSINWLKNSYELLINSESEYISCLTEFNSKNYFEEVYKICAYGNMPHETVPGSMIYKNSLKKISPFREDIRSSEDIIWRDEAKKSLKHITTKSPNLDYSNLPKDIFELTKRYIIYSFFASISRAQSLIKDVYLSLFVIFGFLLIPRWNYLFDSWDQSIFYIDDITKKIYILILISYVILQGGNYFLKFKDSLFLDILKYVFFLTIFLIIYRWNGAIAFWVESSSLYIPNITKIFLAFCILSSILIRGIFLPLLRKVALQDLFPGRWIMVGVLGLYLDLIKAPIYIFGSIYLAIFSSLSRFIKKSEQN